MTRINSGFAESREGVGQAPLQELLPVHKIGKKCIRNDWVTGQLSHDKSELPLKEYKKNAKSSDETTYELSC